MALNLSWPAGQPAVSRLSCPKYHALFRELLKYTHKQVIHRHIIDGPKTTDYHYQCDYCNHMGKKYLNTI